MAEIREEERGKPLPEPEPPPPPAPPIPSLLGRALDYGKQVGQGVLEGTGASEISKAPENLGVIGQGIGDLMRRLEPSKLPQIPFGAEGVSVAPEGVFEPPTEPPRFPIPQPLARFDQLLSDRLKGSGQNFLDVLRAAATADPKALPGEGAVQKGLSVLGAAATPAAPIFTPWGAAGQTAAEGVGVKPETAQTVGNIAELIAGLVLPFLPTGGGAGARMLQKVGVGRTPAATLEAERSAAGIASDVKTTRPAPLPPPSEFDIPSRPEPGPPPAPPKAPPPAPAIAVTQEGQAIPRATGGPVGMSEAEIGAARERLVSPPTPVEPPKPTQTTVIIQTARELGMTPEAVMREVKPLITEGISVEDALATVKSQRLKPPATPESTIPETQPITPPAGEVQPVGKPAPAAPSAEGISAVKPPPPAVEAAIPTKVERTGRPELAVQEPAVSPTAKLTGIQLTFKDPQVTSRFADAAVPATRDYLAELGVKPANEANREVLNRIIGLESGGNPRAVNLKTKSGKDSGLFQFTPKNSRRFGVNENSPVEKQVRAGEKRLAELPNEIGLNPAIAGTDRDRILATAWLAPKQTRQALAAEKRAKSTQSTVGAAQYKPPPYEPEQLATGPGAPDLPPDISQKVIATPQFKALGLQVEQLFAGELPNADARFFRNVGAAIKRGDIVFPGQKQLLERHGLTPDMLGDEFMKTTTSDAQRMNLISQWKKKQNQFLRENPDIAKELDLIPPPRQPLGWFRRIDNTTRALMTGRIGTAVRNFEGGLTYHFIDALDNTMANVATGIRKGNLADELAASMEHLSAVGRSLSPAKHKELASLLDAFPLEKMELMSAPIQDVVLGGKFVKLIQTYNRTQEMFVRGLKFDASVKEEMVRRGLKYDPAQPSAVPLDIIEKGVDDALRITMAAKPEQGTAPGALASRVLKTYDLFPVLSLIQPFPRFQYANTFRFIWEHSPIGPLDLMTKGKLAQEVTASGKPTLAALAAQKELANPKTGPLAYAKAATGIGMFTAALAYRSSENAPSKWYEVNAPEFVPVVGGKPVSAEAFAPFITYNLFAEGFRAAVDKVGTQEMKEMFNTIKNPPVIEAKDLARAVIGMNRIAGTGLVFVDLLQKEYGERGWKNVLDFFGQYIGRVTVPLASYKNILAGVDEDEATLRDVTTAPVTGPIRRNVPILDKTLPSSASITRAEPRTMEHPVFGELSGLSAQTYTQLEKEVNRLNIPWYELGPRTGIPEADLQLKRYMGQQLDDKEVEAFLKSTAFQGFPDPLKERELRNFFSENRQIAMQRLELKYPDLYKKAYERKHRKDYELLESLPARAQ